MVKRPARKQFKPQIVAGPSAPPPDAAIVQFLYSLLADRNGLISHGCVGILHAGIVGGCAMAQARLVALIDPKQNSTPAS